ncbi:MAG: hypothetical protein R2756_09635 [Bacteroidales bacterium]
MWLTLLTGQDSVSILYFTLFPFLMIFISSGYISGRIFIFERVSDWQKNQMVLSESY